MTCFYLLGGCLLALAVWAVATDPRQEREWLASAKAERINLAGLDAYLRLGWWKGIPFVVVLIVLWLMQLGSAWTIVPVCIYVLVQGRRGFRRQWARILGGDPTQILHGLPEQLYTHQLGCVLRVGPRHVVGLLLLAKDRFQFWPIREANPKLQIAPFSGAGQVEAAWVGRSCFRLTWPGGEARFEAPVPRSLVTLEEFFLVTAASK